MRMKTSANGWKDVCNHAMSGRRSWWGGSSSLDRIFEDTDEIVEECRVCGKTYHFSRHHGQAKIQNKSAEGKRADGRVRYQDDILQPKNSDGSVNARYERLNPKAHTRRSSKDVDAE